MRQASTFNQQETFEQWRTRMLAETARFIEWGLANPDKVMWIPRHPVGLGGFSERMKRVYWRMVAENRGMPE